MAIKRRTVLIYIAKDDGSAVKIEGDDAFVYEQIVTDALKLLRDQEPEKFSIFTEIKTSLVRLMIRKVTAPEFNKIQQDQQEDPK